MTETEPKSDRYKALFLDAVNDMLARIKEVDERFQDDQESLNHHMLSELRHWFRTTGKVNKQF